jgi:leucyl aminopeptidase
MTAAPTDFRTDASQLLREVDVAVARSTPRSATAVGVAVASKGTVPRQLGLNRAALELNGFEGKPGQTLVVPSASGITVAVGVGDADELDAEALRDAAAAFARAAARRGRAATDLATNLADLDGVDPRLAGRAVTEGVLLGSYRYVGLKAESTNGGPAAKLSSLTHVVGAGRAKGVEQGATTGRVVAAAAARARELANTPPTYLNASDLADRAVQIADDAGLAVEVFDEEALTELGCGGLLGVNRGSVQPPRMVKLTYAPRNPHGHLALVGKGITYDSGGISLKPSDAFHQVMKMDMSGAAAVLCTMSTLKTLRCRTKVTAFLMCTDNMPSGSALKLGDVLTIRNGKTVEVHNTDAEGRLVLADGLSLAVEEAPDAIVDIATLTGAAVVALGPSVAGVLGNDQGFLDQVKEQAQAVGEPIWQLPLESKRYRKMLDSVVADMRNIGGPYGGTITASIFLSEFVGDVPWAHLDIAGPMKVDGDEGIYSKGATGFGTRLLIELACNFRPPTG